MKDYYDILGVPRDASAEDIKRQFRRLARETHPDANPGDPQAEAQFREIAEAYEVLSDPQRRAAYDRGERLDASSLFSSFAGIEDLLNSFFGGVGGFGGFEAAGTRRAARGPDAVAAVELTLEEAATGAARDVTFLTTANCPHCAGAGAEPGHEPRACGQCGGAGAVRATRRTLLGAMSTVVACDVCRGAGEIIDDPCRQCRGQRVVHEERSVTVDIPAGIDDRSRLRVSGRGGAAGAGMGSGDLYVDVRVLPDERFRRQGDDLYHSLRLGMAEAALGREAEVPLLGGESMPLEVPAGTQPGTVFRVPRRGMPRLRSRGRGDLYVEVAVAVPDDLTAEEEELLREYARLRDETPAAARRRRRRR